MECSRVLLVDDNHGFVSVLEEFLNECEGIDVVGKAYSAEEALTLVPRVQPCLMIVDLSMPGINGFELTSQVRQQWPDMALLVLTLLDTPHHRRAALDAGADAFVCKAYMDTQLIPAVHTVLQQRSPHTAL